MPRKLKTVASAVAHRFLPEPMGDKDNPDYIYRCPVCGGVHLVGDWWTDASLAADSPAEQPNCASKPPVRLALTRGDDIVIPRADWVGRELFVNADKLLPKVVPLRVIKRM